MPLLVSLQHELRPQQYLPLFHDLPCHHRELDQQCYHYEKHISELLAVSSNTRAALQHDLDVKIDNLAITSQKLRAAQSLISKLSAPQRELQESLQHARTEAFTTNVKLKSTVTKAKELHKALRQSHRHSNDTVEQLTSSQRESSQYRAARDLLQEDLERANHNLEITTAAFTAQNACLNNLRQDFETYKSRCDFLEDVLASSVASQAKLQEQLVKIEHDEEELQELQTKDETHMCKFCMVEDSEMIFVECGHLVICLDCAKRLPLDYARGRHNPRKRYPLCRKAGQMLRVFHA